MNKAATKSGGLPRPTRDSPSHALLPRKFYARPAEVVARDLIGKTLVRRMSGGTVAARIVETEAYVGPHDLASHSSKGKTIRNAAMWGPPGRAYVYRIYGIHHCLNVVTGNSTRGEAVLLRAAEPLQGWDERLAGPGLLARGFKVTQRDDHADLRTSDLRLRHGLAPKHVIATSRVGVPYAKEWAEAPLRFLDPTSPHVSRWNPRSWKAPDQGAAPDAALT